MSNINASDIRSSYCSPPALLTTGFQLVTPSPSMYTISSPSSPRLPKTSLISPISPGYLSRGFVSQNSRNSEYSLACDHLSAFENEDEYGVLPEYSPISTRSIDMDTGAFSFFNGAPTSPLSHTQGSSLLSAPPLLPSKPPKKYEPNLFDTIVYSGFVKTHNANRYSVSSFDMASIYPSDRETIYSSELSDSVNPFNDEEDLHASNEEDEKLLQDLETAQLLSTIELSKIETKFERDCYFKSDYVLPDNVSEIVNSRKAIKYDLDSYNGKQWDSFWKLDSQQHKILNEWNPEICERQGTLFEIIVRLQKFRFHLWLVIKFYAGRFQESTSLRFHSKLKREFKKWFRVLSSLYKYTSKFLKNLIQSHFDGKLLANDYLILPLVFNFFKHLSVNFHSYSIGFGYLKIFFSHKRVKGWVTQIDTERPKDWKRQHDIVSSNELFQSYFWLTFSGLKPLFEKLTKIYDFAGNQILFSHSSNILAELKRVNKQANDQIEIYETFLKKKTSAH